MAPNLLLYQLLLVVLVLICLLIHVGWPDNPQRHLQDIPEAGQASTQALHRTQTLHRADPQTALRRV